MRRLRLISILNGKVGYNGNFPNCIILGSIIDLYCLVLILRVWLPLANVDYYNPISQFTLKLTQPVIAPLRKSFSCGEKKWKLLHLVLVFLLCGLKSVLFGGLNLNYFLLLGILGLIKNIGIAIFYVLIAGAILSWFNRGNNPAFYALYQLTEPLLKPIKRILPTVGAIDFSPMVIAIILLFLNNLFYDYFNLLWAIAA